MNKTEKQQFVCDLIGGVQDSILALIKADKIPDEWDGHELRQLIADHFARQTTGMAPPRKRAYRNNVLVNNLD